MHGGGFQYTKIKILLSCNAVIFAVVDNIFIRIDNSAEMVAMVSSEVRVGGHYSSSA